jgi:hypothetical protein
VRDKQRLMISVRKTNGKLIDFELIAHKRVFCEELALDIYSPIPLLPRYEFQIIKTELEPERTVGVLSGQGGFYVPVVENLVTDDRAEEVLTTWAVSQICHITSDNCRTLLQKRSSDHKDFLALVKSSLKVHCVEFLFY